MRRVVAEFVGTAFLLAAIVGSGIMGEQLAGGNVAIALLANTIATGAALVAVILAFGPVSGAHFNPVVSFSAASQGGLTWSEAAAYAVAQLAGALIGVAAADYMFGRSLYAWSHHARAGLPQAISEAIATFGLVAVIWSCSRRQSQATPFAVGAFITAAYWFTPSTSFANPAVTVARSLTNTFTGIRPTDVLPFVVAQFVGGAFATALCRWLVPPVPRPAPLPTANGMDQVQRKEEPRGRRAKE
jgi:glycerol uptake facilitator-like aquaporin